MTPGMFRFLILDLRFWISPISVRNETYLCRRVGVYLVGDKPRPYDGASNFGKYYFRLKRVSECYIPQIAEHVKAKV